MTKKDHQSLTAAELRELRSEADRQHGDEAQRRHFWKVAIPVFAVTGIISVIAAVVWVANQASAIVPG